MNRLMPFYEAERRNGGTFDQGIEQIVAAVLASPQFLYRSIRGPKGVTPNTEFALTDLELASRLSFFLWNTGPDEELLTLASANGLTTSGRDGETGEAHARRSQGLQPGHQFRDEVAESHRLWISRTPTRSCSPDSTSNCGAIFRRKRKPSSAASSRRTEASWNS